MRRAAVGVGLVMLIAAGNAVPTHAQVRGGLTFRPPTATVVPRAPIAAPLPVLPLWWQWPVVMLPEITTSSLVVVRLQFRTEGLETGDWRLTTS